MWDVRGVYGETYESLVRKVTDDREYLAIILYDLYVLIMKDTPTSPNDDEYASNLLQVFAEYSSDKYQVTHVVAEYSNSISFKKAKSIAREIRENS